MNSEQIRTSLNQMFDRLNTSLADLRSRVTEAKHEARAQWELQSADLERRKREAQDQVRDFRGDSAEAWSTFRTGMESTWQSLQKTCQEALAKFK